MQAGWHPDPTGRHELRYFNGSAWTGDVADAGARGIDLLGATGSTPGSPAPAAGGWPATGMIAPTAGRRSNGLGVAGMVLGIVGVAAGITVVVFYAGTICGVLALVFGLVARRRLLRAGDRVDGPTRAALILGPVALVLSVVGGIVFFTLVVDLIDELERVAPADSFELDDPSCSTDAGQARYAATLTNTSGSTDRFTVRVEFVDAATADVDARGSAVLDAVGAGDAVPVVVTALVDVDEVDCRIDEVLIGRLPFGR